MLTMLDKRLRFEDLVALGLFKNRTTLSNWIRKHGFPPGQLTSPNCRTWGESEIFKYIATRPIEGPPRAANSPLRKRGGRPRKHPRPEAINEQQ
jgi:hypothetical protein